MLSFCSFLVAFSTKNWPASLSRYFGWGSRGPLDPSKKALKTNGFSTFPLFSPTKPEHIRIILAISCLEAHLLSFCSLFGRFFTKKPSSQLLFSTLGVFLPLWPPRKNLEKPIAFQHFHLLAHQARTYIHHPAI